MTTTTKKEHERAVLGDRVGEIADVDVNVLDDKELFSVLLGSVLKGDVERNTLVVESDLQQTLVLEGYKIKCKIRTKTVRREGSSLAYRGIRSSC